MKKTIISIVVIGLLTSCQFSAGFKLPFLEVKTKSGMIQSKRKKYHDTCKAVLHPCSYMAYDWHEITDSDDPRDYIFPEDWQEKDDD